MHKDSALFSVVSDLTLDEYKKMFKCIPEFYWSIVKSVAVRVLIVILIISLIYRTSILATFIVYIIALLLLIIIYKIKIDWLAEKVYKKYIKKFQLENASTIAFYDDYLIWKNDNLEKKIEYSDINKLVESETDFYIQSTQLNIVINIRKSDCNKKLEDFIRNISNSYVMCESKKNNKIENKSFIRNILLILFVLTILSFYGATFTLDIVLGDKPTILSNDYMWVFWFWIPIPLLSIILGFKYRKQGFKSTKNIVAGFIIGISLLVFGSFSFIFPSVEIEYKEINNYKNILNVDFPKKGILTQEKYDSLFDDDKINITTTQAFYKGFGDLNNFENSIVYGNNWIKVSDIKTDLKIMISSQLNDLKCKSCYSLIYNEDTDEYNKIPDHKGKYNIYVASYNVSNHRLKIDDFTYIFKK